MYFNLDPQSQFIPTTIPIPRYRYTPYARAYMMFQSGVENLYTAEEGFKKGTMFPELYVPYPMDHKKMKGGKEDGSLK